MSDMSKTDKEIIKRTIQRLLEKSQEAFLIAIELYNRPTIKYHVEGCSFFLCNAWELMLKASLIKRDGINSIYYADNASRTLSLEDCLRKIYTNKYDPLRANMEKAIDLRNTSTHFVVEEYEQIYTPILQACVENFDVQMKRLHGIEISDLIPENYLVLSVKRAVIDEDSWRARYTENDMIKMLETREGILTLEDELNNRRFACTYVTELRTTKKSDAALTFRMAEEGETPATVLKTLVKPFDKYPYRPNKAVEAIILKLEKEKTVILYGGVDTRTMGKSSKPFNMYHFGLFTSYYSMKSDDRYSTNNALPNEPPAYIYSQQAIDLIISRLIENPTGILDKLKAETKKVV